jgi:hypothetical protein
MPPPQREACDPFFCMHRLLFNKCLQYRLTGQNSVQIWLGPQLGNPRAVRRPILSGECKCAVEKLRTPIDTEPPPPDSPALFWGGAAIPTRLGLRAVTPQPPRVGSPQAGHQDTDRPPEESVPSRRRQPPHREARGFLRCTCQHLFTKRFHSGLRGCHPSKSKGTITESVPEPLRAHFATECERLYPRSWSDVRRIIHRSSPPSGLHWREP